MSDEDYDEVVMGEQKTNAKEHHASLFPSSSSLHAFSDPYDDPNDPVVEEIDVFSVFRGSLADSTSPACVFQFPHWPAERPLWSQDPTGPNQKPQTLPKQHGPGPNEMLIRPGDESAAQVKAKSMKVRLCYDLDTRAARPVWDDRRGNEEIFHGHGSAEALRGQQMKQGAENQASSSSRNPRPTGLGAAAITAATGQTKSATHALVEGGDSSRGVHYVLTSQRVACRTGYAIGVMRDLPGHADEDDDAGMVDSTVVRRRELHLTPVTRILQFRPDMTYVDAEDTARRLDSGKRALGDETVLEDESRSELVQQGAPDGVVAMSTQFRRADRGRGARGGAAGTGSRGGGAGRGRGRTADAAALELLGGGSSLHRAEAEEAWVGYRVRDDHDPVAAPSNKDIFYSSSLAPVELAGVGKAHADLLFPLRKRENIGASDDAAQAASQLEKAGYSMANLQALPNLSAQVKTLIRYAKVITYPTMRAMCSHATDDDSLLAELVQHSVLVRSRWIAKSQMLHNRPHMVAARDYLLLQLHNTGFMTRSAFCRDAVLAHDVATQLLDEICYEVEGDSDTPVGRYAKPSMESGPKRWILKRVTDPTFAKIHAQTAQEFSDFWSQHTEMIFEALRTAAGTLAIPQHSERSTLPVLQRGEGSTHAPSKTAAPSKITESSSTAGLSEDFDSPGTEVASRFGFDGETAEEQVRLFLVDMFTAYGVCNMEFLRQAFAELQRLSHKNNLVREVKDTVFKQQVKEIADTRHAAFYLRTTNPADEAVRNVILELFGKAVSLKKADVTSACKEQLDPKFQLKDAVFNRVMAELAVRSGTSWVFKSGDGRDE